MSFMPLLHHQPFKLLYLLYFVAKLLLVKIPFWTVISLPRSKRPRRSWSIGRCLRVYALRSVVGLPVKLGMLRERDLTKEVPNSKLKKAKFTWVEAVEAESLKGEVRAFAEKVGVGPARVPGYWQLKQVAGSEWTPEAKDGEKVVYHLYGGGFYLGTAHPSHTTVRIPRGILEHSEAVARTFAVDYRLSASAPFPAANPFPTALLDCIAGYRYLVGLGFQPENIIVAGDSAGGNLALALVRYLTENAVPSLARPGKLLLLSPWGDLSSSRSGPDSSMATNMRSDMFPAVPIGQDGFGSYGVTSYLGTAVSREEAKTNKYLSPSSSHLPRTEGMFNNFPRTYVLAGGAERILDDSKVIAERIKADNTCADWVTLDVPEDAVHDFCVFPWHEPERSDALARVSRWIDQD